MCTAISLTTSDTYFGRNLDLEFHYKEELVHTPRQFALPFRQLPTLVGHYAMLGTAYVPDGFPLYYDALNEHGLAMAGLNFPQYAHYAPPCEGAVAPFEVIPLVLASCRTVGEACELLRRTPIAAMDYSEQLSCTPLHWMLADKAQCVAVEMINGGLQISENPIGVLTNSPPFDFQLANLSRYTQLTPHTPSQNFGEAALSLYSRGMGTEGLPGGYSSTDRFVRAAYGRAHSVCDGTEEQSVMQMFHLLDSVAHPRGCVVMPDGRCEITVYSCCMNLRTGAYYYKTYNGSVIHAVDFAQVDLSGNELSCRPMRDVFEVVL